MTVATTTMGPEQQQMRPRLTFAVIITCYNYARYVGNAIESVLNQSHRADEIIVVDDGSTDSSREVIAAFGPAIRPIFQANAGHVAARNAGFARSTADIIMFLDADDVLLPTALERIADIWTDSASKAQFDLQIIDGAGRHLSRKFCDYSVDYDAPRIAREFEHTGNYLWPVTSGNAYARRFIEPLMPMDPPQAQDGVLNTLAPLYGTVLVIPEPLGLYRVHGQSVSRDRGGALRAACPNFARRIEIRRAEFAILADHAARLGKSLPRGDLLNYDIVFVNYRLIARKLRLSYTESERDHTARLCVRGIRLAWSRSRSWRARCSHSVWFIALGLCPRVLARTLIELRFDRANIRARVREWAGHRLSQRWLGRENSTSCEGKP